MITKTEVRRLILEKRKEITLDSIENNSKRIIERILSLMEFQKSNNVWLFAPLNWEVDLFWIMKLTDNKRFYFPKVRWNLLEFGLVKSKNDLKEGSFGILEPINYDSEVYLDMVFVPWLAFTVDWKRIWFWKWFYDKYLCWTEAIKVWVCFDYQIFDDLQQDELDVKMDYVLY